MRREVREITDKASWLDWRKVDMTASRVSALFGEHKFLTIGGIEAEMRGGSAHGDNPAMRAGRILEPAVAAAIAEEHPDWRIVKATTYHRLPDHRLGATPDVWLDDDALIQIKTVSPQEWETWHGHPPLGYTLQTLTELLVTDKARGVLAVMVRSASFPLHLYDVPRHAPAERRILNAVESFWRNYDRGQSPIAEASGDLAEMLDDGTHKDLSGDNLLPALLEERAVLKNDEKAMKARLDVIDYEIKNRIGPARTGWLPGWLIKFPTIHTKEYTVAAKDNRRLMVTRTEE